MFRKQQKRDLHSSVAMLDGVSIDASHVVNELMQLESDYQRIRRKIAVLDDVMNVKLKNVVIQLNEVMELISKRSKK